MLGGWTSFWETDLSRGADALRQTILSHLITAKHAAPMMIRERRGLIVAGKKDPHFLESETPLRP